MLHRSLHQLTPRNSPHSRLKWHSDGAYCINVYIYSNKSLFFQHCKLLLRNVLDGNIVLFAQPHLFDFFTNTIIGIILLCIILIVYSIVASLSLFHIFFSIFLLLLSYFLSFFSSLEHYMQFYLKPQGVTADLQKKNVGSHSVFFPLLFFPVLMNIS